MCWRRVYGWSFGRTLFHTHLRKSFVSICIQAKLQVYQRICNISADLKEGYANIATWRMGFSTILPEPTSQLWKCMAGKEIKSMVSRSQRSTKRKNARILLWLISSKKSIFLRVKSRRISLSSTADCTRRNGSWYSQGKALTLIPFFCFVLIFLLSTCPLVRIQALVMRRLQSVN